MSDECRGKDAWVEVDLSAIKHNLQQVRKAVGTAVKVMAVVKANAYGHGAVETSKALLEAGTDALAVTRLDEAERLRSAGITAPVLVFDSIQPESAGDAVALGVDVTVCTSELVDALGKAAQETGSTAQVHLKIDSGMGRLGVLPDDAPTLAKTISETQGVQLAGTYTHLATAAEKDLTAAHRQLERFRQAIDAIRASGVDPGTIHAANSAAILRLPEAHFDMVRPGTILYGQYPSRYVPRSLDLKNTWTLKARISFIKSIPKGYSVGYGGEFVTRWESRIAVIPLGWADSLTLTPESVARRGILRLIAARLRNKPALSVTIRGRKAPVIGRIAMQMCSVDVTDILEAEIGDEVIIPARRVTMNPLIQKMYTN